jgi:hypothetical protein
VFLLLCGHRVDSSTPIGRVARRAARPKHTTGHTHGSFQLPQGLGGSKGSYIIPALVGFGSNFYGICSHVITGCGTWRQIGLQSVLESMRVEEFGMKPLDESQSALLAKRAQKHT